jgi:hypothetical protein
MQNDKSKIKKIKKAGERNAANNFYFYISICHFDFLSFIIDFQ